MRARILGAALAITAFLGLSCSPNLVQADPGSALVEPGLPRNACTYNASAPNATGSSVMTFRCDASGNLKVTGISGTGTSGGFYNPSPTPFPTSTAAPSLLDAYGETLVAPGPHATAFTVICASGCTGGVSTGGGSYNPSPSPAPAATALPLAVDAYGNTILSSSSLVQAYPAVYSTYPPVYQDGQAAALRVDQAGQLMLSPFGSPAPVDPRPPTSILRDWSTTISSGGTAQILSFANPQRRGFWLQNLSSGTLWINVIGGTATASQPSIAVYPSTAPFVSPVNMSPQTQLSIYGATTGQAYTFQEW